ncbi:MAG: FAD-dependent oxidoreductase [Clostridiaceae bacterium]|nr:FAD-dependent oxidoreductase [Clostridiaceae bacterium]
MAYPHLFSPIKIRGMVLKNRVVFPAMATNLIEKGGFVTDRFIDYHVARALGGNGLNTTEATSVHKPSAPYNFLSISDDQFIPGLKRFADAIRAAGGKSCVQLWQGGFVVATLDRSAQIIVPNDFPVPGTEFVIPAASKELIHECVAAFGAAARRCAEAGIDCVEFHAAHGYSPHSFLSGGINKRTDEYGGSLENRTRYPLACIASIRKNIPDDMPLLMRIVAHDDYLENGLTIEEIIEFSKMAGRLGVDALNVSRGNAHSAGVKFEVPPIDLPRGFNVDNAARIKKETGMITIAVGRINDPQQAEDIIAGGKADMVVMGRAQIADPEFCNKAASGHTDDIVRCIACNQGCVDRYVVPQMYPHLSCLRNPAVGREKECVLVKTNNPRKVLIAGGGMGGLETAFVLKQRGHEPILCEESGELGGQFLLAGVAPRKGEMRDAAVSRSSQVVKAGVDVRLNTRVTPDLIGQIKPDVVVIATGASPAVFDVPGIGLPHVHNSHDIMSGRAEVSGRVIVVGGGLVGLEVAEYLAEKKNCQVTVIEMMEGIGRELGTFRQICVMENVYCDKISPMDKVKCLEIKESSMVIERAGKTEEWPCDAVVVAIGAAPNDFNDIKQACEERNIASYVIGDAKKPRRAIDAIHEGYEIARMI